MPNRIFRNNLPKTMSLEAVEIAKYCILSEIFFFNIIGLFGNIQLLWTTYRKKTTHTKPGFLLALNAFYHIICLLGELTNATFIIADRQLTRRQCYPFIMLYVFAICQQVVTTLLMGIDLLAALLFPIWYRRCSTTPYLAIMIALGTLYALFIAVWGFVARNDDVIAFCNPPLGLAPTVSMLWSSSNVVINSVVVFVYVTIIILVRLKAKSSTCQESRRVIKRLKVTAIVFVFSWYMAILGVNLGYAIGLRDDALAIFQSNMVFFALLCYSQTFYVCLWRSLEYRSAFYEQMYIMVGRSYQRKPGPITSSTTRIVVQPITMTTKS